MHDVSEEEEALPQRRHVLPWEPLQQWYVSHFLVFLHKISILIASVSLHLPCNSDWASFSKLRKLHFLLHSTPLFSLIVFLCLKFVYFQTFSHFGVGKPKNDAAADWNPNTTFSVVWFTGRLHRTCIFKEAKDLMNTWSSLPWEGYNRSVCIPILSSGDWRKMSMRQSPGDQTIKPEWRRDCLTVSEAELRWS